MLLTLMLMAADPAVVLKTAVAVPAEPRGEARSPYRLDPSIDRPYDIKGAAIRATGRQCAITGPTLCTKKQRTLYTAPLGG